MKNILVLTDFSEAAYNATEYAVKLAVALKANVTLFHAITIPKLSMVLPSGMEEISINDDPENECLLKLEALSAKIKPILNSELHKPLLSFFTSIGNIKDSINKITIGHNISLIIMGARLYEDFPGFLFGTKVRGVVEVASCPILLIHEKNRFRPVKNILYVTDLRYCDLMIVTQLITFAGLLNAHVSLMHVCSDGLPALSNEEASAIFLDTIASHINSQHLTFHSTNGVDTHSVINRVIEKQKVDILAIAHKKYHFFNHLFRKNTESDTYVFSSIPIMVIPDN